MYSPMPGPKGTVANMLNAVSVPAKKPAFDHAPSTEPCEVAWIACSAGTSAPGSLILRSIVPAETRSTFLESLTGASPISVKLVGKALAMFRRTFCGAWAAADPASRATAAAAARGGHSFHLLPQWGLSTGRRLARRPPHYRRFASGCPVGPAVSRPSRAARSFRNFDAAVEPVGLP